MKTLRSGLVGLVATTVLSVAAFAADPTGTWKWTAAGRNGQQMDVTAKLAVKDGQLSGTVATTRGETAITNATVKDDDISFTVVREMNGRKLETKYEGKVSGDTITGKVHAPSRGDAEGRVTDWTANRAKDDAAAKPAEKS